MSSSRIERIQRLFEQALALQPHERAAFLAEHCATDTDLLAEVTSLIAHDAQAHGGFLQTEPPVALNLDMTKKVGAERDAVLGRDRASGRPAVHEFQEIAGYQILRELHRGGQGVVYEAHDRVTKRKVAIKVLLEGPYASRAARRRFEREIELVASLKHPNIVAVFHSGQMVDGRQFCVMDYVRGVPLTEYIRSKKPPLEEALRLFATVCEAVNYAHQKGVIHRDLKPSNILVDVDGTPKVLDFGLAKMIGGPEQTVVSLTGQVVGTLPYMSPEQARGNPDEIDIRTDVYALGVIVYELLTGHYPYPVAGQMAEVLQHIAETQPTPPSRHWTAGCGVTQRSTKRLRSSHCPIDDEVETIVLRSLAKERDRRYQSAGELASDITSYLNGQPILAKRDSGWYWVKKFIRRRRVTLSITSATFLLLAFLSIATWASISTVRLVAASAQITGTAELPANSDPETASVTLENIKSLINAKQSRAAVTLATTYKDSNPQDPFRWVVLGWVWLEYFQRPSDQLKQHQESDALANAQIAYTTASALDAKYNSIAAQGLGHVYFLRGRQSGSVQEIQNAIREYSKAIEIDPDYPLALSNRGHAYFERGEYALAANDYARATRLGPDTLREYIPDAGRTYKNYATALRILGRPNDSVAAYRISLELDPRPYTSILLAVALADTGHANAIRATLNALRSPTSNTSWTSKIAACLCGDIAPETLIGYANGDDQLCEAQYYAGEVLLRAKKPAAATDTFSACMHTCGYVGKETLNECRLAKWRLGSPEVHNNNDAASGP